MKSKIKNMIQANELRLGNILDVGGNYWQVSQISDDELYFKENEEYNHILNAEPIPLTEDILLKCGFEKYDTDKAINYKLGGFRFSYVNDGKFKGKTYLTYGNVLSFTSHRAMEYLHSFQNLYWSFCQKELEIKL